MVFCKNICPTGQNYRATKSGFASSAQVKERDLDRALHDETVIVKLARLKWSEKIRQGSHFLRYFAIARRIPSDRWKFLRVKIKFHLHVLLFPASWWFLTLRLPGWSVESYDEDFRRERFPPRQVMLAFSLSLSQKDSQSAGHRRFFGNQRLSNSPFRNGHSSHFIPKLIRLIWYGFTAGSHLESTVCFALELKLVLPDACQERRRFSDLAYS